MFYRIVKSQCEAHIYDSEIQAISVPRRPNTRKRLLRFSNDASYELLRDLRVTGCRHRKQPSENGNSKE